MTKVIAYNDGAPTETYTNCSPIVTHDGVVEFFGTLGSETDTWIIPLDRIASIH